VTNSEVLREKGWRVCRRYVISTHGPSSWLFQAYQEPVGDGVLFRDFWNETNTERGTKPAEAFEIWCGEVLSKVSEITDNDTGRDKAPGAGRASPESG
jgi:hypothetical protein